jgi:hypothetical protein
VQLAFNRLDALIDYTFFHYDPIDGVKEYFDTVQIKIDLIKRQQPNGMQKFSTEIQDAYNKQLSFLNKFPEHNHQYRFKATEGLIHVFLTVDLQPREAISMFDK